MLGTWKKKWNEFEKYLINSIDPKKKIHNVHLVNQKLQYILYDLPYKLNFWKNKNELQLFLKILPFQLLFAFM